VTNARRFIIEQPEFADQFGLVGKTDEAATSIEECSPLLQGTFPARFIAPCLPTKTDPPRLRQTGIHFLLTPRMQTGDHGQPQRPGRLGRDFGGRFILGGRRRDGIIRSLEATMRRSRPVKREGTYDQIIAGLSAKKPFVDVSSATELLFYLERAAFALKRSVSRSRESEETKIAPNYH
jgi:hypothetical protein